MKEGWADDITTRNRVHYYKDGVSLCNKAKQKFHMTIYRDGIGSKWNYDCSICVKKQKELKED